MGSADKKAKKLIEGLEKRHYPTRAAYKLLGALDHFRQEHTIDLQDRICLDLGCAQGGFVKVLLDQGAHRVYAVDVGYGLLDYALRKDERVIVCERKNVRNLNTNWFSLEDFHCLTQPSPLAQPRAKEKKSLFVTCDLSFISSISVLEVLYHFSKKSKISLELMLLIKPQFEASQLTTKGIQEDIEVRQRLVEQVRKKTVELGFCCQGTIESSLKGRYGNLEYILYANLESQ